MTRLLVLITLSGLLFFQTVLIPVYSFAQVSTSQMMPLAQTALPEMLPNNAITWPLLPNESIASLATLFYPNNAAMQTRFIARTLEVNNQAFTAGAKAQQVTLIVIPELKSLSSESGLAKTSLKQIHLPKNVRTPWKNPLQMSYALKDAAQFIVSPKLVADYDNLVKRNEFLKVELQKLNDKLSELQALMTTLTAEAVRTLSVPNSQKSAPDIKVVQSNIASQSSNAAQVATPITRSREPANIGIANSFWLVALAFLLLFIFIIAFKLYGRNRAKHPDVTEQDLFKSAVTGQFKAEPAFAPALTTVQVGALKPLDFSLTQSSYVGNTSGQASGAMVVDWGETAQQEESEQILEQARIFVNIDRTAEAVELLKAQIKAMPMTSLHHWLYLLDIFRDQKQKDEFLAFAKELHEHFNVMMPQWDNAPLAMVVATSLEQFPHIVETLTSLWSKTNGYLETKTYLHELLTDNREKERMGFTMQVFEEIVCLSEILEIREKLGTHSD